MAAYQSAFSSIIRSSRYFAARGSRRATTSNPGMQSKAHYTILRSHFHTNSRLDACKKSRSESSCHKSSVSSPAPSLSSSSVSTPQFWSSNQTWRRASLNTLRCLIGCTLGDFSAMWYLQALHPDLGMQTIMAISMASGITTSLLLETVLLRMGRDRLPWIVAAKTAAGMSMISMVVMEIAENAVDYHLMGGNVQFDSPAFWGAALISVGAGFLAPLPYNYVRLRKYGRSCH